jgi:hypothetical protein
MFFVPSSFHQLTHSQTALALLSTWLRGGGKGGILYGEDPSAESNVPKIWACAVCVCVDPRHSLGKYLSLLQGGIPAAYATHPAVWGGGWGGGSTKDLVDFSSENPVYKVI